MGKIKNQLFLIRILIVKFKLFRNQIEKQSCPRTQRRYFGSIVHCLLCLREWSRVNREICCNKSDYGPYLFVDSITVLQRQDWLRGKLLHKRDQMGKQTRGRSINRGNRTRRGLERTQAKILLLYKDSSKT